MLLAAVSALIGVTGVSGCERSPEPRVAQKHAEVRALYHADRTRRLADEMIFLHPNSERQRRAREAQLMLDELIERMPDPEGSVRSENAEQSPTPRSSDDEPEEKR